MSQSTSETGYLEGQLLIAMPAMVDTRFAHSVIYLFAHSSSGAMGLVVNKLLDGITFPDLIRQLGIESGPVDRQIRVHFGGPVETGRGFVLHSADYQHEATLRLGQDVALTTTIDVLKAIATGHGPRRRLLALGYAGWAPGQLDAEIQANGWLNVAADEDLIFGANIDSTWTRAMSKLGIDLTHLAAQSGHA
jgi:putative transcriptional regulator